MMVTFSLLTAFAAISVPAVVVAQYGAMEAPGVNPRRYLAGAAHLVDRAAQCTAGQRNCLDVGFPGYCCSISQYCIVINSTASCCSIGSTCKDSGNVCSAASYECPITTTVSGTVATSTSCCPRSCTSTSNYLCASSLGGQCCPYNSGCASNSQCVATSTTGSMTTGTSSSSTATNSQHSPSTSSGLSTGAKAGIGAGVAVGALVVIAALSWFCISTRRKAAAAAAAATSLPAMSNGGSELGGKRPSAGRSGSDYFGPTAGIGPFTEPHDSRTTSPGQRSGVPLSPQGPGDITAAVEIDSRGHVVEMESESRGHSNVTSPGAFEYRKGPETKMDPVELP